MRAASRLAQSDDARSIARDGYIYGYPLVLMGITKQIATAASGPGQFVHMLSGPTPVFRIVVAPNGDTRYSSAWIDLSAEPQILHVPDAGGRYFVAQVMDAWTDVIADPTPRIADSSPANYVLVGPNWKGVAGPGQRLVRSSTNDVWILARTRARPDDPPDAITAIQQQYTVTPLSRFGDASYEPPRGILREPNVPTGPTPPSLVAAMPADVFFARLAAALGKNPPRASDAPIVARLARIGVVPGQAFDAAALDAARALSSTTACATRARCSTATTRRRCRTSTAGAGPRTPDVSAPATRTARSSRRRCSPRTCPKTPCTRRRASTRTAHRSPASAATRCTSTVRSSRRHNAFWSLTLYSPDHYLVPNAIDRYTLRDTNLRRNADGSIDVAIQHDTPAGDRTNWLPAPAGPFVVTLRMYWPLPRGPRRHVPRAGDPPAMTDITERTVRTDRHQHVLSRSRPRGGPLLVFVHGWPALSIMWRRQLEHFAGLGYRCIAPDMRGYGRSSAPRAHDEYALELIVQDMVELLQELGAQRAIWVGHDWGSPVVWSMAGHHPELCPRW